MKFILVQDDSLTHPYPVHNEISSLYMDFKGNPYLVSQAAAFQIWLSDSSLIFIDTLNSNTFKYLQSCIETTPDALYQAEINITRQKVSFIKKWQDREAILYHSFDTVGEKAAITHFYEIISYYHSVVPEIENIILNGSWAGKMHELNYDRKLNQMITWNKILTNPIDCKIISRIDEFVILDQFNGLCVRFDKSGIEISRYKIDLQFSDIIYDYFFDKIYYIKQVNMTGYLYSYDAQINTHKKLISIDLKDKKRLKIHDGKLFFLQRMESGFQKLMMMSI